MWWMPWWAAEAADDRPRASMIAAPRLPTVGRNTSAFQTWSLMRALTLLPPDGAERYAGSMVGEWLPQTVSFSMSPTAVPVLAAIWLAARLWSRRSMAVKFL